jgi:hypothetical protein
MQALALSVALLAAAQAPQPSGTAVAAPDAPVILFLVDNSASLPPLDPDEQRVDALEKMFTFLEDQPYRLILFGGRGEVTVDQPRRYRNDGQWTDFFFAFETAREVMASYPEGTRFRIVLVTDGILDPSPRDWEGQQGDGLKTEVAQRLIRLIQELEVPLYVILIGATPDRATEPGDRERSPELVLEMVRAANGRFATPRAQSMAAFFEDDGLLLKKFIYRVQPHEGLTRIEPVVRRIVAASHPLVELQFLGSLVLPLLLFVCLLLGILVRSFPGRGDVEVVELSSGSPVHVGADRFHKVRSGGWATQGLSLVAQQREAAVTFSYESPDIELSGRGIATAPEADPTLLKLLPLGIEELRKELRDLSLDGAKDEKIFVLNLNYMAANFDSRRAEQILTSAAGERGGVSPLEFLQAKAHLLVNQSLRTKLVEPRVQMQSYGRGATRRELTRDDTAQIGRYVFRVKSVARGGRKDIQLVLTYEKVPSLLGLKNLLPEGFQKLFRLRRSSWRVVTS